jgi:hypothetical protein
MASGRFACIAEKNSAKNVDSSLPGTSCMQGAGAEVNQAGERGARNL